MTELPALVTLPTDAVILNRDDDDAEWLTERVAAVGAGIQAAIEAAFDIAKNWWRGRCVGRLYPALTAAEYLFQAYGGPIRLESEQRRQFLVALIESGSSRRQAARAAGVDHSTANRAVGGANAPPKPLAAPRSRRVRAVPARRRSGTAAATAVGEAALSPTSARSRAPWRR